MWGRRKTKKKRNASAASVASRKNNQFCRTRLRSFFMNWEGQCNGLRMRVQLPAFGGSGAVWVLKFIASHPNSRNTGARWGPRLRDERLPKGPQFASELLDADTANGAVFQTAPLPCRLFP